MALRPEAVQNSVMPIGNPCTNRSSAAKRHLFIDKSCELSINDFAAKKRAMGDVAHRLSSMAMAPGQGPGHTKSVAESALGVAV